MPGLRWEIELVASNDKTAVVGPYCPDGEVCDTWPVPDKFPPECDFDTGMYCELEKIVLPFNVKEACSAVVPYNCVGAR
jgi:hypothetical protein